MRFTSTVLLSFAALLLFGSSDTDTNEECLPYIICYSNVNVSLPNDGCETTILEEYIVAGSGSTCGLSPLTFIPNPGPYGPGTYTVTATARIGPSYVSCQSQVIVEDKTAPTVNCYDPIIRTSNPDIPITIDESFYDWSDNCEDNGSTLTFSVTDETSGYGTYPFTFGVLDPGGNSSSCTGTYSIRPYAEFYCTPTGNTNYEYIERVAVNGLSSFDNRSGDNNGYGYYVNYSASLRMGQNASITLEPGYNFGPYQEYWQVFIDYNDDNYFNPTSELVYQWAGTGTHTGSFPVSGYIWHQGTHRMRVVMQYGSYGGACHGGTYGETEDYLVNLNFIWNWPIPGFRPAEENTALAVSPDELSGDHSTIDDRNSQSDSQIQSKPAASREEPLIYPNPWQQGQPLHLRLPQNDKLSRIIVHNGLGRQMAEVAVDVSINRTIDLSTALPSYLPPGMYIVSALDNTNNRFWSQRLMIH